MTRALLYLLFLSLASFTVKAEAKSMTTNVDTLLKIASSYMAIDIDSAEYYAVIVYENSHPHSAAYSQAKNIKARVEFSRMHYLHSAEQYISVIENSRNQLDILEAEVGLMKIYQRTSDNISFYEYRNSALRRMQSIESEQTRMESQSSERFNRLVRDFRTVSSLYYYELEQLDQADREYAILVSDTQLRYDVEAFLLSLYLKGLGIGIDREATQEEQLTERARSLNDCLRYAERRGNQRLQAMSIRAMAALLLEADNEEQNILLESEDVLESINRYQLSIELLPVQLLSRSMQIFAANGCVYDMIECYRILAAAYIRQGNYYEALNNLSQSLLLFNDARMANYPETRDDSLQLQLYREDYLNVEEIWIEETPYATVPESMSSIREQISLAYSGLGDIVASDYSRNVYLELQKTIRLDRRYEARSQLLRRSNGKLIVAISFLVVILLLVLYLSGRVKRKLREKNRAYAEQMMKIYTLCTRILNTVSDNHSTIDSLNINIIPQIEKLIGMNRLRINLASDYAATSNFAIPLTVPGSDRIIAYLISEGQYPDKEKQMLLNIISPYISSVIVNSDEYGWQQEQYNEVVEQHNVYRFHAENNKRETLKRKTYCSVVAESLPYIERMKLEIMRLSENEKKEESMRYISELVERINGYNELLSTWIQMRQGVVKLTIENFELQELFEIVAGSSAGFRSKGVTLTVLPTDAVVRADKSLTLFMINTLAENSGKFTESGGQVTISALQLDDCVEISVADTGIGMSQEQVKNIRETKIYNSSSNGGFGLINCKGIIDKYKKTDQLFDVCSFDLESTAGKGSRFFFRLPKGVKRTLLSILILLSSTAAFSDTADSLLNRAYYYAEQTYLLNVDSYYDYALEYADSALVCLNQDYLNNGGDSTKLISMQGKNNVDETVWLADGFATDYETLLWIRNEVAISALALGDWELYEYNNDLYLRQFKLYYAESAIEQDTIRLQRYNGTLSIVLILILLLFVLLLVFGFLLHVKYLIRYRSDMQQVLTIMDKISKATTVYKQSDFNVTEVLQRVVDSIIYDLDQIVPLNTLSIITKSSNGQLLKVVNGTPDILLEELMVRSLKAEEIIIEEKELIHIYPLIVNISGNEEQIGVMGMTIKKDTTAWREQIVLVAQYLAATLHYTILRFELGARNIEQIQEDSERIKYEDNRLHVRNLVLDNSLSTLKHETIYYPNRIKQLVESGISSDDYRQVINEMQELVSYYRDIYSILSHNVIAQAGENIVTRKNIKTAEIFEYVKNYCSEDVRFVNTSHLVIADETLLKYLMQLLVKRLSVAAPILSITAKEEYGFVKFSIISAFKQEQTELDNLFHPLNNKDDMAYVLCRQIIREHDDIFNHIGCRINADSTPQGTVIWFTLPAVTD